MSDAVDPTNQPGPESPGVLQGKRIALVGRLASMSKRDAARLIRGEGGTVLDKPEGRIDLIAIGEAELPDPGGGLEEWFDPGMRQAAERGEVEIITENQLWQRLGLVDQQHDIHHLYTPAMLAELLGVSVAVIRRWHRRGLIVPVREVRRLPYFDFREVAAARRMAELLAAGVTPRAIEKKLEALVRYLPGVERPLAQLSVIVRGKEILLRQGDGLLEPGGQLRFDFEAVETAADAGPAAAGDTVGPTGGQVISMADHREEIASRESAPVAISADQACRMAAEAEEEGHLDAAVEMYHVAMVMAGPTPETCFQVAELLYRLGDAGGARERYYMAIELDEDYVEARANLGCVLAETGRRDLAVAAFEGALRYHPDYADVHYHLARTLDEMDRPDDAAAHWQAFLDLAPDSPWAEEARNRLRTP